MTIIKTTNKAGFIVYRPEKLPCSKKCRSEKLEQIDLNSFCLKMWPVESESMFHIINESGGSGSSYYGEELNKQGRKKGVPDWPVMVPRGGYHGLFVEIKRENGGSISKEQKAFFTRHLALGYQCIFAYGYKAALVAIKEYLDS